MTKSAGIHHITAIAGEPKRHVAFYTRTLGLRFVKRTVNFDDPGTWHLYYGDEVGAPGTALTFFIWKDLPKGQHGAGEAQEIAFAIPEGSLDYWIKRLDTLGVAHGAPATRFGETAVALEDPDGLKLELVTDQGRRGDPRLVQRRNPRRARHPRLPWHHARSARPSAHRARARAGVRLQAVRRRA